MRKIILVTAISSLFATSIFAGESTGDIDFDGSVVNPPCIVKFNGSGSNYTVGFGEIERNLFGTTAAAGKIVGTEKYFTLKAEGFECDTAELRLTLGVDTVAAAGATDGLFLAKGTTASNTTTLPIMLINRATDDAALTSGSAPETPIRTSSVGLLSEHYAEYDYETYVVNLGAIPDVDSYRAQVQYKVVN